MGHLSEEQKNMGERYKSKLIAEYLPTQNQDSYASILDVISLNDIKVETDVNRSPRGIHKLQRFSVRIPNWWPLEPDLPCSVSLYIYYSMIRSMKQYTSLKDMRIILFSINKSFKKYYNDILNRKNHTEHDIRFLADPFAYKNDYVRQYLKKLSSLCFPKIFTHGPSFMLFTYLHALTSKAPFKKEKIYEEITEWVDNKIEGRQKNIDRDQWTESVEKVFSQWKHDKNIEKLGFREYCNDFFRWSTSGGAPPIIYDGDKLRSKWAWAYSKSTDINGDLLEDYDLYKESLKERQEAGVALKEEPTKTREVIATPLSSYLRQSYLLYRWGKPKLESPISDSKWVSKFEIRQPRWMGCTDGDRFDHSVPKWVIMDLIYRLGSLDDETRNVMIEELKHLEKLQIQWSNKVWNWRGGLLSGWRITSLVGTLVSYCAAQYIIKNTDNCGAVEYGAMGDDLILYSNTAEIDSDTLVHYYKQFGLIANINKTTSGRVGEYLRKVISEGGSYGYPANGLKTIVYANPWVSNYSYENHTEMANAWMTLYSRLLPHAVDVENLTRQTICYCIQNLTNTFGQSNWGHWLQTPISAGGGGCIEWSDQNNWTIINRVKELESFPTSKVIPRLIGIIPYNKIRMSRYSIDMVNIRNIQPELLQKFDSIHATESIVKHNTNITKLIFDIVFQRAGISQINSCLEYPLPRFVANKGTRSIVDYIFTGLKSYGGLTAVTHTKEAVVPFNNTIQKLSRSFAISHRFKNITHLNAMSTLYAMHVLGKVKVSYGTW